MKNKIIVIGGYCATGKSTFSNRLSKELNVPCFNKDTIKEILGDGFGPESGEVFQKGSYAAFLLMYHITERILQSGNMCILESNFKLFEIEKIKALAEKYNGECLLFRFTGNLEVLFDRYSKRHNERHWVHKSAGDREGFKTVMHDKFSLEGADISHIVTVDTTSFEHVNYDDLLDIAKKFTKS